MGKQFEEHMKELASPQEQAEYLREALQYCAEKVFTFSADADKEAYEKEIEELKAQNKVLSDRLEKAKDYFRENKTALDSAEERTKAILARNLQSTRDELYVIGSALHALAVALTEKSTAKMSLVEVNNLQVCVSKVIDNLLENGLWNDEMDVKPDLTVVEKARKPRTSGKGKKNESREAEQLSIDAGSAPEQTEE